MILQLRALVTALLVRRAVRALLLAGLVFVGVNAYMSYGNVKVAREVRSQAIARPDEVLNVDKGLVCIGNICDSVSFPEPGQPHSVGTIMLGLDRWVDRHEARLSPRRAISIRLRALATAQGVLLFVLLGASAIGADWTNRLWRLQLLREPRRGRLLLLKLGAVAIVAVGFVICAAVVLAVEDTVMRSLLDIRAGGGPSIITLGKDVSIAGVVAIFFAGLSGSISALGRSTLIGAAAPLLLLVADSEIVKRAPNLRFALPVQQVASLVPVPPYGYFRGARWFAPATEQVCMDGFCRPELLSRPAQWLALLVLIAWLSVAALGSWVLLRRREIASS